MFEDWPSPDRMLLARMFSYADSHRYRLGVNYQQIPVNAPVALVHTYSKDGAMRVVPRSDPAYFPNSKGGPQAYPERYAPPSWYTEGDIMRTVFATHAEDDDFGQVGVLVRHQGNHALRGAVVFSEFAADAITQVVVSRFASRPVMLAGPAVFLAGLAVLTAALSAASMPTPGAVSRGRGRARAWVAATLAPIISGQTFVSPSTWAVLARVSRVSRQPAERDGAGSRIAGRRAPALLPAAVPSTRLASIWAPC
jgi:hypothetical protein